MKLNYYTPVVSDAMLKIKPAWLRLRYAKQMHSIKISEAVIKTKKIKLSLKPDYYRKTARRLSIVGGAPTLWKKSAASPASRCQ